MRFAWSPQTDPSSSSTQPHVNGTLSWLHQVVRICFSPSSCFCSASILQDSVKLLGVLSVTEELVGWKLVSFREFLFISYIPGKEGRRGSVKLGMEYHHLEEREEDVRWREQGHKRKRQLMAKGHSWARKEKQQRVVVSGNKTVFQSCLCYLPLLWFTRNCITPLNLTFPFFKMGSFGFCCEKSTVHST